MVARPIVVPRYADGGGHNPRSSTGWHGHWPRRPGPISGLGPIVRAHPDLVVHVDVDGSNPDVDTPDDLAALEASGRKTRR